MTYKLRVLMVLPIPLLTTCTDFGMEALTIVIHPYVGEQPLQLASGRYTNPGGEGEFWVRDFQFFISNLRVRADHAEYREPESYHLVRFDGPDSIYQLKLDDMPRQNYREVEFGIGVDARANGTITISGDLDPNGRMAWSWDVGYKFVLFEGGLERSGRRYPLVYHVGFDENYFTQTFALEGNQLELKVDLLQIFQGATTVDVGKLSNVKFDRQDARQLANNYRNMIQACDDRCSDRP